MTETPTTRMSVCAEEVKGIINGLDYDGQLVLKQTAMSITDEASTRKNYDTFLEHFNTFVKKGAFTLRLPVGQVKKLLTVFVEMWNDADLAKYLVKEVFDIDMAEIDDTVLPLELVHLDEEKQKLYRKALKQGYEKVKNIRLMVVGMFGVGKSSLVKNLVQDLTTDPTPVKTTEGIEVHKCKIVEGKWIQHVPTLKDKCIVMSKQFTEDKDDTDVPSEMYDGHTQPKEIALTEPKGEPSSMPTATVSPCFTDKETKPEEQVYTGKQPDVTFMKDFAKAQPHIQYKEVEEAETPSLKESTPLVSIWDFAGQNIYYTTHHFFLNSRSIYVLLMDVSKPLETNDADCRTYAGVVGESFTCLDSFRFWLQSFHMYSSIQDKSTTETVILVGTHKDKLVGSDEEKREQMENYFNKALLSFKDTPAVLKHVYKKKFLVNNLEQEGPVFDELKETIEHLAKQQPYWNELVPANWIELVNLLDESRQENKKELITMADVIAARDNMNFPIKEKKHLIFFLDTQHLLGNYLYYDTDKLRETVILNPQWTIEAFKSFISHVRDNKPTQLPDWDIFDRLAILTPGLVNEIMKDRPGNVKRHTTEVIAYMEQLDIIAEPVKLTDDAISTANLQNNYQSRDFHIVPCLLKSMPSDEEINIHIFPEESEHVAKSPILCYVFKDNFMHPAVFHRLLASSICRWPIARKGGDSYLLFNGFGIFTNENLRLALWFKDHRIYCRVIAISKNPEKALSDQQMLIKAMRKQIEICLEDILSITPSRLRPFEEYVQCNCKSICWEPGKGLIRKNDFVHGEKEVLCEDSAQPHSVSWSDGMSFWF